jgi:hypothetical protein
MDTTPLFVEMHACLGPPFINAMHASLHNTFDLAISSVLHLLNLSSSY